MLGKEVVRLRFNLNSPADLIVPHGCLVPKNKTLGDSLDVMASLAQMTTVTLYLACLSEKQLRPLCNAILVGSIHSVGKYTDLTKLYNGRGARILNNTNTLTTRELPLPA